MTNWECREDQSSKRSVLERLEFSEKQCELQAAAPWLCEAPMLRRFVKPGNNSYFAPLRQVVSGHFQLYRKPLLPSQIYKWNCCSRERLGAAQEPAPREGTMAGRRPGVVVVVFSPCKETALGRGSIYTTEDYVHTFQSHWNRSEFPPMFMLLSGALKNKIPKRISSLWSLYNFLIHSYFWVHCLVI